ncbi:MAG TPA: hypothetical protein VKY57_07070 [Chitinispirillaceae bacterium]|jgi:ABC-type transport system involved in multi-copper enzyme maturation permease subunit|nr:hypothetical protein [Fibrobacter sp.]HLV31311.1 hypothetical protein [Chitinispirillaceae bacterium]
MNKKIKIGFIVIGLLLIINGAGNIIDDSRVLTYDITSVFSGLGFFLLGMMKNGF